MRQLLASAVVVLLAFCGACTASVSHGVTVAPPTPGKPDAVTAVNARSAIDQAENIHSTVCEAAVTAHHDGTLSDAKFDKLVSPCDAMALAENTANDALGVYLRTGTFDALQALNVALNALAKHKIDVNAANAGVN